MYRSLRVVLSMALLVLLALPAPHAADAPAWAASPVRPLPETAAGAAPAPAWDLNEEALAAISARARQVREPGARRNVPTVTPARQPLLVQEYYDTCGDAPYGDLDRFFTLDDQAAEVAWAWTTCADRGFRSFSEGGLS